MNDHQKIPRVARIWRGRTRRDRADEYEAYNYEAGIRPLIEKAMGVQTLREDGADETEFVTISYWESIDAMHAWKNSPEFPQHMGPVQTHVAEFTPQEMELVAQS